jgi:hypothetical protein
MCMLRSAHVAHASPAGASRRRYRRLEREAAKSGASVGALVRRAIDVTFPGQPTDPARAAASFLAADPMPVDDWDAMKREMLDELYGGEHRG